MKREPADVVVKVSEVSIDQRHPNKLNIAYIM